MTFSFTIPFVSSRKSGSHSYDLVPAPDEEILLASPDAKDTRIKRSSKRTFSDPSFWLTTVAALSIVVTIRNLFVIQLWSQEPYVSYLEAPIARPYTGLEQLPRNKSSPSWPLSSTLYPDFIGSTQGTAVHHTLNNGSVVRLDSERMVIIQHRVRDYGLEYCAVQLEFSPRPRKQQEHTARAYGHIGESPYLTLWRLEDSGSKALLTSSALPTSLPTRKEFLGNITLDAKHPTQSSFFRCRSGSIQTLEITMACATDPCIMEFRLTESPRRQGFWVVQTEQEPTLA